jgi:putative ABC transport system permease protein
MISGREFRDFDRASSQPVAIVNQQFASRNWPGEIPVGKRLRLFAPWEKSAPWLTVVGVVSNIVQNDRTRQTFDPLVYLPDGQHAGGDFAFVRTSHAPGSLAAAVRREIYAVDPNLPVLVLSCINQSKGGGVRLSGRRPLTTRTAPRSRCRPERTHR